MSREVYIHIGYPKTGTTFLQNEIFPKLNEVHYIRSDRIRPETSKIMRQEEFSFDYEQVKNNLEKHLVDGKNLISNEGFMGNLLVGKAINNKLIADRLAFLFPNVKIIITIRNQYDLVESLYKQYIQLGGTKTLREFVKFKEGRFEHNDFRWDLTLSPEMFNYATLAAYYEKLVGRENVFLISFELLQKDPARFLDQLLKWMGVDETPSHNNRAYNQGYGRRQIAIARFLNRFLKSIYRENGLIPDVRFPLAGKIDTGKLRLILQSNISRRMLGNKPITDPFLRAEIKKMHSETNKSLDQRYSLHLQEICPNAYF